MPSLPTLQDVAREAGVALSTASLALQGKPRVAAKTRARVEETARRLGYRSNAAATVLGRQRAPESRGPKQIQLAFLRLRPGISAAGRGAAARAHQLGYQMIHETVAEQTPLPALARRLWHVGVGGILVEAQSPLELDWQTFDVSRFAVVKIGRVLPSLPVPVVRTSAPESMFLALDHIREAGYRRILCLQGRSASRRDDDLRVAVAEYYGKHHMPPGAQVHSRFAQGEQETAAALRKHKPDALMLLGIHFVSMVRSLGYRIPRDIACAIWPAPVNAESAGEKEFAGVHVDREGLGAAAVDHVHRLIIAGEWGLPRLPTEINLPTAWQPGHSLPPKPL